MKLQKYPKIGFIGLGNMGSHMTKNSLNAGYSLTGYDIDNTKCAEAATIGVVTLKNTTQVVKETDVIMTSLHSSDVFFNVAEMYFLPNAIDGKIFIDLGTSEIEKHGN